MRGVAFAVALVAVAALTACGAEMSRERAIAIARGHVATREGIDHGSLRLDGTDVFAFPALGKRYLVVYLWTDPPSRPGWDVLVDLTTGEVAAENLDALRRAEVAAREAGVTVAEGGRTRSSIPPFDCPVTFVAGGEWASYSVRPAESPESSGWFRASDSVTVLAARIGGGDEAEVTVARAGPGELRTNVLRVRCGSTTTVYGAGIVPRRLAADEGPSWSTPGEAATPVP